MIDDPNKSGEWKIHLTLKLKFMSSVDCNEKCARYSKSNSSIVTIDNDTDEIIQKLFDSLFHKYQIGLDQP